MNTLEEIKKRKTLYMKKWTRKNPDKVKANRRKSYLNNLEAHRIRQRKWLTENKEHKALKDKEYQEINKEKIALNKRSYYLKNRQHLIKVNCERKKERLKTDPIFSLKSKLRTQIIVNLIQRKYKKSESTEDLLGARIETVLNHLENLFQPGMTWENHGIYGWHIDHVIPLASAKNKDDLYKLFHFTNLQPLWAFDNLSKGSRITYNKI